MSLSLPTEVLATIFSLLNPNERCEAELVCQKWHRTSRSMPSIWRNASRIAGKNAPDPVSLRRKLDNILLRSGGKLDSLDIRISGSSKGEADASRYMLGLLAEIEVKHLRVDCGTRWFCQSDDGKQRLFSTSFSNSLRKSASWALSNCSQLRSLRIATPQGSESLEIHKDSPFANSQINLLTLLSDSVTSFFVSNAAYRTLRKAKSIQIRSLSPTWGVAGISVPMTRRLLQTCQETLEHAEVEIQATVPQEMCDRANTAEYMEQRFYLPRLSYLKLIHHTPDCRQAKTVISFASPRLLELCIDGTLPAEYVINLIDQNHRSLEIIELASVTGSLSHDNRVVEKLCRALQKAERLRRFCAKGASELILKQILRSDLRLKSQELVCYGTDYLEIQFQTTFG